MFLNSGLQANVWKNENFRCSSFNEAISLKRDNKLFCLASLILTYSVIQTLDSALLQTFTVICGLQTRWRRKPWKSL